MALFVFPQQVVQRLKAEIDVLLAEGNAELFLPETRGMVSGFSAAEIERFSATGRVVAFAINDRSRFARLVPETTEDATNYIEISDIRILSRLDPFYADR